MGLLSFTHSVLSIRQLAFNKYQNTTPVQNLKSYNTVTHINDHLQPANLLD